MSDLTPTDVRSFLKNYLGQKFEANGRGALEDLPEDCDLLLSGIVDDSIGFLDLTLAIQEFAGREIDFEILDPEEMSIVGHLCRFVSQQTNKVS
jgi:acyl carrier protein